MREQLEILTCDMDRCESQVVAGASRIVKRARDAGWQVRVVTALGISEDGPELTFQDRCPDHPTEVIPREVVLHEAGGPGGVQPWEI